MQLAATLVEYFVSGCGALLWLLPLFARRPNDIQQIGTGTWVLVIPLLYAFGMTIHFAAHEVLAGFMHRIKEAGSSKLLPAGFSERAFIWARSPDLARALELRSTRDRIARGFLLNLVLAIVVTSFGSVAWFWPYNRLLLSIALVAVAVLTFGAWYRLERLTLRFRREAIRLILFEKPLVQQAPSDPSRPTPPQSALTSDRAL